MRRTRGPPPPWEQAPRKRHGSSRGIFSVRKQLFSKKPASRRPLISAPSNFQHLNSGALRFPEYAESRQTLLRPRSFHPLELSIYQPNNQLSPMVPHFGDPAPPVTPPQQIMPQFPSSDDSHTLSHPQSLSSVSFHIPRKPTNTGSVFDSPLSEEVITRPSPARLRSRTCPEGETPVMTDLLERVASAMLERDRLQDQIDDVIERQSIYISSRPSTATGLRPMTATSMLDLEPMPEVPALPPNAPSFKERLSIDRPRTAPVNPPTPNCRRGPSAQETRARNMSPRTPPVEGRLPPPPLPLHLRPPLRKKKSFSQVSSWLGFPDSMRDMHHGYTTSIDSITNQPKPLHSGHGFYQVATPVRKSSFGSDNTASDWSSEADAEGTVPSSWSPGSSAATRAVDPPQTTSFAQAPYRASVVGVAF
jgi:hypothetical protein